MVTLVEIVQFLVHREAAGIFALKTDGLVRETIEKFASVSPDRKSIRSRRPTDAELDAGWRWERVRIERLVHHIAPTHPRWREYQTARNRASMLLTARLLLKLGDGQLPDPSVVREAIRRGELSHHIRLGQRPWSVCAKALRILRKLAHRLDRAPHRFDPVVAWRTSRDASSHVQGSTRV